MRDLTTQADAMRQAAKIRKAWKTSPTADVRVALNEGYGNGWGVFTNFKNGWPPKTYTKAAIPPQKRRTPEQIRELLDQGRAAGQTVAEIARDAGYASAHTLHRHILNMTSEVPQNSNTSAASG
ncbi:hypothetical protein [Herbaspirillum sp.]|uniref:hypothetical protein n=1 Tax=Herbaspirillum sp. TaxID=1890675 RepID=UPI00258301B4|nr:hypothetical protein [Herbaspirillum sp.]MCP3947329.1 hypothetical protein [Herbaspirillum sp.]